MDRGERLRSRGLLALLLLGAVLLFPSLGDAPFERAEIYFMDGARAMVERLKSLCAQQNVFKMWVHTNRSNPAAIALYASTGGTPDSSGDELSFRYDFGTQ